MQDRRMYERFQVNFPIKFLDKKNNKEGMGQMVDISAGGGGMIITEELLEPTTPIEIWFPVLEEKNSIHSSGRVVWAARLEANKFRVGIKFDSVSFAAVARALRIKVT